MVGERNNKVVDDVSFEVVNDEAVAEAAEERCVAVFAFEESHFGAFAFFACFDEREDGADMERVERAEAGGERGFGGGAGGDHEGSAADIAGDDGEHEQSGGCSGCEPRGDGLVSGGFDPLRGAAFDRGRDGGPADGGFGRGLGFVGCCVVGCFCFCVCSGRRICA